MDDILEVLCWMLLLVHVWMTLRLDWMGTQMLTLEQTHLTVIDSGRGSNSTVAVAAGSGVQFSSEVVVGQLFVG
jgi:hypothetical protein